ncbi:hypothetical protein DH2020_016604 [Rehmannia glutinosa]|uniref:NAC domain-containing protein n=1 Tax=Rehmannia glutinosa TaxID=99300 RepID=A0ABR0WPL4_REHGL
MTAAPEKNGLLLFHAGEDMIVQNENEYIDSILPVGYTFSPTDEELINHYLINKIKNKELPVNIIREVMLYDWPTPEQLTENYKPIRDQKEWYFFTPRNKIHLKGGRPSRSTPGGYWKATVAAVDICSNGRTVGQKTTLCFFAGKPGIGNKTNWIMHEYCIKEYSKSRNSNDMKVSSNSKKI